eukprot:TRINITY_DN2257_c0_g1_i1.p1 TRINITY_DN2257_c0_g1~~TRINITY_DN2257_c0_g1_i1.p1  ORF type:complete len:485 (-),score=71.74 TRINITY_DN2257_c0_g1_i1:143-1597(-)
MTDVGDWVYEDEVCVDNDYFLALQLQQAELLRERFEEDQSRDRSSPLKYQKVSSARYSPSVRAYYTNDEAVFSGESSYSDSEEYELDSRGPKRHHTTSKTGGRSTRGGNGAGSVHGASNGTRGGGNNGGGNGPGTGNRAHGVKKQAWPQSLDPSSSSEKIRQVITPIVTHLRDCFDEKTSVTVEKLFTQQILQHFNAVSGQGKESTIYHATGGCKAPAQLGESCAVKVFKTNMEFNNKEMYINGLWLRGCLEVRVSPRKFLKLWAEKEFRNLYKLSTRGIPAPRPIVVRNNVVVMSFIGKEGWPAPRLVDCVGDFDAQTLDHLYWQAVVLLKRMYKEARMVHAAFSPYNLLVQDNTLVIIDVSQSVHVDHKYSTQFLRRDCDVITKFFKGRGTETLRTRVLYEFVSNKDLSYDGSVDVNYVMDDVIAILKKQVNFESTEEELIQDQIWMNLDLPKYLKDILDPIDLPEDGVFQASIDSLNLVKQ